MIAKKIITWVGIVSGIMTILWSFGNPFVPQPKLSSYVETNEYVTLQESDTFSSSAYRYITKIEITNTGDKVATKVHIDFKTNYNTARIINGNKNSTLLDQGKRVINRQYFWLCCR